MKRNASAVWEGGLKEGHGTISTDSGVLHDTQYSFKTRFENGQGTNPEELIAAAHAGCFSMAFSAELEAKGFIAQRIKTSATVTLEKSADGFSIPAIHLNVVANVVNIDEGTFEKIAHAAKEGCPVSKLMNAKITMETTLDR